MVDHPETKTYPYIDLENENGIYYYSKDIHYEFLYHGGLVATLNAITRFYWSLMEVHGKDMHGHEKVIDLITQISHEIKIPRHENFGEYVRHSLNMLNDQMRFWIPGYLMFIADHKREIESFSMGFVENKLQENRLPIEKLISLVDLSSEYEVFRLKLKNPEHEIKEIFDFNEFEKFKAFVTIEIQRLEKTMALKSNDSTKPDLGISGINNESKIRYTSIEFNEKYIKAIYSNLKFQFDEKERPSFEKLLHGEAIEGKLTFRNSGNQLADIFKQFYQLTNVIINCDQADLEDWLVMNFLYYDMTKKGRIAEFKKGYLIRLISGTLDPCKSPLFEIYYDASHNLCFRPLKSKQKKDKYY